MTNPRKKKSHEMSSTSVSVESTPPWLDLPRELTAIIMQKLGQIEILTTARKVCTTWRSVCHDPAMWRTIDLRYKADELGPCYGLLRKLCRHAVNLSKGQLVDIDIKYFGTNELLLYISEKSNQLKRLRLTCCLPSNRVLIEAVKKLPVLEELHLINAFIGVAAIEAIGRCCPRLKSFTLNYAVCDPKALAIARNMRGLRHLQLLHNEMTNVGLDAIIFGCPHLESFET